MMDELDPRHRSHPVRLGEPLDVEEIAAHVGEGDIAAALGRARGAL